jgi:tripartite-type tricarboxylate transporter receptor subunit TctC
MTQAMLAAGILIAASSVCAQGYPSRPVRIVTAEPGGGPDFAARLVAPALAASIGQQVIVDNRGLIAIEMVSKAAPDGYTMLLYGSSIWLMPYLRDHVSWDVMRDFAPVSLAMSAPDMIVVHPSLPVASIRQLIALAKARPGELNYSASSPGATSTLGAELFKSMAHVDITRIQYKGTGPAVNALLGGETQVMFPSASAVTQHVKSGRLRALAVSTERPSPLVPGLPTVAASGVPGYESVAMYGFFVPVKTPDAAVRLLNQGIVRALKTPDISERFLKAGVEPGGGTPEELLAAVKAEIPRLSKVIKDAGIRGD